MAGIPSPSGWNRSALIAPLSLMFILAGNEIPNEHRPVSRRMTPFHGSCARCETRVAGCVRYG